MRPTIPATFFETAERQAGSPALWCKSHGRYQAITYGELARQVRGFTAGLQRVGVPRGGRVAILAPNGPAWAIADLGTIAAGAVTVPIHASFSPALIRYVLEHASVSALVVGGKRMFEKVAAISPPVPTLKHLVLCADVEPPPAMSGVTVHRWEDFISYDDGAPISDARGNDLASIVYTSGTTGLPKGVMLSHRNFLSNVHACLEAIPIGADDVFLSFLPLSHVLERTAGYYAPISVGAQIAYAESPATLKENLREIRPTILIAVPRLFEKTYDAIWAAVHNGPAWKRQLFLWALRQPRGRWQHRLANALVFSAIRRQLGGRLRLVISGGASLHVPLAKFFDRVGLPILEGYGLTETAPVVSVNTQDHRCYGSVGCTLAGVEVKILPDKEILVRGPNVCSGYWQDEAATRELVSADGWLHTGDLGFFNRDGFLFIIGRSKEMLVTAGGKNIWPQVLENGINGDPLVAQSMVVAHGRPYVTALVVPVWLTLISLAKEKGWPKDRTELAKHPQVHEIFAQQIARALAQFPDYEQVRRFTLIVQEFSDERDELTPTQKLRRSVIERHCAEEIEAMYRK